MDRKCKSELAFTPSQEAYFGLENVDCRTVTPATVTPATSCERWQFGELEYYPHPMMKTVVTLRLTVTQRLGKQGMKLKKLFSDLKEKTLSYMADNGHGPEDENSVQKLNGFNYIDFDHAQDLMDFLFPCENGTSLLALGSYGAACGNTRTISIDNGKIL